MQSSLSNVVDNLSEINNKEPNKFMDTMRSMTDSLSQSMTKYQRLMKKYHKINLQIICTLRYFH